MIAKGNFHSHGVRLAAYLVKAELGERGELIDMRGFGPVSDLRDGFRVEQIRAQDGTRADQPFFHVHFRGAHGEGAKLSRAEWIEIANRCDTALGWFMPQQPRAARLHIDRRTGDMHLHLGYSLVAENEDGKLHVLKLGLYKNKLKHLARELEKDYGLKIVSNKRQPGDRARAGDRNEFEESRRLGTDLKAIRTGILDCFEKSDNGKAVKAALDERSLRPATGGIALSSSTPAAGSTRSTRNSPARRSRKFGIGFRLSTARSCRASTRRGRCRPGGRRRARGRRGRSTGEGRCTRTGEHAHHGAAARARRAGNQTARQDRRRNPPRMGS
jgi:hypothetical protein